MFAPKQSSAISETGVSVARFFEGTTPSGGGASFFPSYRNPVGDALEDEARNIACLRNLFGEMSAKTWDYLHTAARDGNYLTTLSGVKYISESRSDAFGHCWIGCRGAQECGQEATFFYGEAYENVREILRSVTLGLYDHNSFEEDVFNQRMGRELARNEPEGDAFAMTYQALVADRLHFHGHSTGDARGPRVYVCEDIMLGGHLYEVGWHIVPMEFMERY